MSVTVTIARKETANVVMLEGPGAITVVMQGDFNRFVFPDNPTPADLARAMEGQLPVVSVNCSNNVQVAICAATMLSSLRDTHPEAMAIAFMLLNFIQVDHMVRQQQGPRLHAHRGDDEVAP